MPSTLKIEVAGSPKPTDIQLTKYVVLHPRRPYFWNSLLWELSLICTWMSPAKYLVMNWNILPGLTFCISIWTLCFNSFFLRTGNYEQHGWDQTHKTVFCLHVWLNHTPLFPRETVFYAVIFFDWKIHACQKSQTLSQWPKMESLPYKCKNTHRRRRRCVMKHTQCTAPEHKQLTFQPVTCLSWRSDQMVKSNTDISSSIFAICFSHFTTLFISIYSFIH